MKKWFKKFLKNLEEANKKNFGEGRLDCCETNQKSNGSNKTKNK